jgi:uncharacterized protein YggT (Ycf19 family)
MSSIDLLLNIAGVLLWLNWRSFAFDPLLKSTPATLVGTLKRAEPHRLKRWQILTSLGLLLFLRAVLYWQLGSAADWTPKIDLVLVVLPFRISFFESALLYSLVSFARVLTVIYFWFLALAFVNRGMEDSEPLHKLVRLQLGRLARLPRLVQFFLPLVLVTMAWFTIHPFLVHANVITTAKSWTHLLGQGLLVSAALYLSLKYLFPLCLLIHLIISYVYVGRSPVWDYISATSQRILSPLRGLPLRFARIDFGPVIAAVLILVLLDALPKYLLLKATQSGSHVWPQ